MGKILSHSSAFIFDHIFFILAVNKDNHNISEEFEIHPDRTKDCGAMPLSIWKNPQRLIMEIMLSKLGPSCLIRSSSFLQVIRTTIWMSFKFGQIRPWTAVLSVLEHLKNRCIMLSLLLHHHFDWIFFIFAGNKDNYIF